MVSHSYTRLNSLEGAPEKAAQWLRITTTSLGNLPHWRQWRKLLGAVVVLLALWAGASLLRPHQELRPAYKVPAKLRPATHLAEETSRSSYFHLVLPAARASENFCKSVFSAGVMDFPTPWITNWRHHDRSSIGKMRSVQGFLEGLGIGSDDDIMVIAAADDVWFQLRPSVLINRFHALNAKADALTQDKLGLGFPQRILFASQARCALEGVQPTNCLAASSSVLATGNSNQLSSATVVGFVGDLRRLYQDAVRVADKGGYKNDAGIFAHLFGKQERSRLAASERRSTDDAKDPDRHGRKEQEKPDEAADEYGIGLDYQGAISQPTVRSGRELSWVTYGDAESNARGFAVAGDISQSTPPFWSADLTGDTKLPRKGWKDVPLLANADRGVSPPIIHHSARRNDDDSAKVGVAWEEVYYHGHLRPLLVTKANAFRAPAAVVTAPDGVREEWWGPIDERGSVVLEEGGGEPMKITPWDEVCGSADVAEEVFGDTEGPWENPIYYLPWGREEEMFQKWKSLGGN